MRYNRTVIEPTNGKKRVTQAYLACFERQWSGGAACVNSRRERSPCSSPTSRDRRACSSEWVSATPTCWNECRHLLRTAFHQYHGHEVDTQGDAFFVAFARATDAVSAAVAAQRALASHAWPEGVAVRVRMGLHTGEPHLAAEGYVGLDVHRAARIMNAGHGGQILLSQTTRDLVEHESAGRREPA